MTDSLSTPAPRPIAPGATIGIFGGGQLGRMLAMAAAQLGYRVHIYAPEERSPAAQVANRFTHAEYDAHTALDRFARECDAVTYEFENVPVDPLEALADSVFLAPPPRALAIAQSRNAEKCFVRDCGGVTAPFVFVDRHDALAAALAEIGGPAIVKSDRFGYDGKGQVRMAPGDDPDIAWRGMGGNPCVVEGLVDFSHEFSLILVRGEDGEIRFWDAPHNIHVGGILACSTVPAPDEVREQAAAAEPLARCVAEKLDYVGVLTLEFFATDAGPVFNEMAPRVHNSGHWTIEGAYSSQFENHIRAICGLPLGDTAMRCSRAEMLNLIGEEIYGWPDLLAEPSNHVHIYGKREARAGRKMGHVTRITP